MLAFKYIDDVSMGLIYQKNFERFFNSVGIKSTEAD
jgi:hypothetical protein